MDWNKTNIILITAFIILNVFLLVSLKNMDSLEYKPVNDEEFVQNVKELLKERNITINADIPEDNIILPILETKYDIINVNSDLLHNFLNEEIEPMVDVYTYGNSKGETLEIIDKKQLKFILRDKKSDKIEGLDIIEEINKFLEEKNIDAEGYEINNTHIFDSEIVYIYTKKHNDYSMDNSYMNFFADNEGIYKFEMQEIISSEEITEKVRLISAMEALPRILTYPDINNKEIIKIEMTYYSVEDENWQNIERINSYPTWKITFNDGTQKHLPSVD